MDGQLRVPTPEIEASAPNGAGSAIPGPPEFRNVRGPVDLPSFGMPAACTVARDRWDRLVTTHVISESLNVVWRALSEPAAVAQWLGVCSGALDAVGREWILDFEDGEYMLGVTLAVVPERQLRWAWRWMGIGPAWTVTWQVEAAGAGTRITVVEDAFNPPSRWQYWNGEGWPGILEQLETYVRLGNRCRWPWRREGYALIELPVPVYDAWDRLLNPMGLKYWLPTIAGSFGSDPILTIHLGDASGSVQMTIKEVIPPSFRSYPSVTFSLTRPSWGAEISGRLFMEPAGWGRTVFQVFHAGWENVNPELQLAERRLLAAFWADAMRRAAFRCGGDRVQHGRQKVEGELV